MDIWSHWFWITIVLLGCISVCRVNGDSLLEGPVHLDGSSLQMSPGKIPSSPWQQGDFPLNIPPEDLDKWLTRKKKENSESNDGYSEPGDNPDDHEFGVKHSDSSNVLKVADSEPLKSSNSELLGLPESEIAKSEANEHEPVTNVTVSHSVSRVSVHVGNVTDSHSDTDSVISIIKPIKSDMGIKIPSKTSTHQSNQSIADSKVFPEQITEPMITQGNSTGPIKSSRRYAEPNKASERNGTRTINEKSSAAIIVNRENIDPITRSTKYTKPTTVTKEYTERVQVSRAETHSTSQPFGQIPMNSGNLRNTEKYHNQTIENSVVKGKLESTYENRKLDIEGNKNITLQIGSNTETDDNMSKEVDEENGGFNDKNISEKQDIIKLNEDNTKKDRDKLDTTRESKELLNEYKPSEIKSDIHKIMENKYKHNFVEYTPNLQIIYGQKPEDSIIQQSQEPSWDKYNREKTNESNKENNRNNIKYFNNNNNKYLNESLVELKQTDNVSNSLTNVTSPLEKIREANQDTFNSTRAGKSITRRPPLLIQIKSDDISIIFSETVDPANKNTKGPTNRKISHTIADNSTESTTILSSSTRITTATTTTTTTTEGIVSTVTPLVDTAILSRQNLNNDRQFNKPEINENTNKYFHNLEDIKEVVISGFNQSPEIENSQENITKYGKVSLQVFSKDEMAEVKTEEITPVSNIEIQEPLEFSFDDSQKLSGQLKLGGDAQVQRGDPDRLFGSAEASTPPIMHETLSEIKDIQQPTVPEDVYVAIQSNLNIKEGVANPYNDESKVYVTMPKKLSRHISSSVLTNPPSISLQSSLTMSTPSSISKDQNIFISDIPSTSITDTSSTIVSNIHNSGQRVPYHSDLSSAESSVTSFNVTTSSPYSSTPPIIKDQQNYEDSLKFEGRSFPIDLIETNAEYNSDLKDKNPNYHKEEPRSDLLDMSRGRAMPHVRPSHEIEETQNIILPKIQAVSQHGFDNVNISDQQLDNSVEVKEILEEERRGIKDFHEGVEGKAVTAKFMNVTNIVALALCTVVFILIIAGGVILYKRRQKRKPRVLDDAFNNSDASSSAFTDTSVFHTVSFQDCAGIQVAKDNFTDEMFSLDNDSFLNSLEAMAVPDYWTDTIRHTKL